MTYLLLLWADWLFWLGALSVWFLNASSAISLLKMSANLVKNIPISGIPITARVMAVASSFTFWGLLLFSGWMGRDISLYVIHTTTDYDVKVVAFLGGRSFLMRDARKDFKIDFCDDFPVDIHEGEFLKEFVYEDRGICKSVSASRLGYRKQYDTNGIPIKYNFKNEETINARR